MITKTELGIGDRVGELDDKVRAVMRSEHNPMVTTLDITSVIFGRMFLSTQTKEYRRVKRSLERLQKLGEVWCYNQGQRSAVIWLLKSRVKSPVSDFPF